MEQFAVLMLLGVRVREVRDLTEGSVFVEDANLLLVDDRLEQSERELICRAVLGLVQT